MMILFLTPILLSNRDTKISHSSNSPFCKSSARWILQESSRFLGRRPCSTSFGVVCGEKGVSNLVAKVDDVDRERNEDDNEFLDNNDGDTRDGRGEGVDGEEDGEDGEEAVSGEDEKVKGNNAESVRDSENVGSKSTQGESKGTSFNIKVQHQHPSGREWERHVLGPTIAAVVSRGMVPSPESDSDTTSKESNEKKQKQKGNIKAKVALLRMLPYVINLSSQRARLETLIRSMESSPGARPLTEGFASLGLSGRWLLLFSSTTLGSPVSAGLRIRRIGQRIDPTRKMLINFAEWSLIGRPDPCEAVLFVKCTYEFVSASRINVELKEHEIRAREDVYRGENKAQQRKSVFPKDVNTMVQELQRSLPKEFFDPSGYIDISYLDTDFRLARYVGKKFAGVRNVYVRDIPINGKLLKRRRAKESKD